jgi:hypothetical protein
VSVAQIVRCAADQVNQPVTAGLDVSTVLDVVHLDATRACADDPDPLAGYIKTLLRPKRGVMALPGEIAQAR